MPCCDTCPLDPTCEEMSDFLDQIGIPADHPLRDYDRLDGTQ